MSRPTITLDVREDLRNGREPFSKIMNVVGTLRPDDKLILIAPFEPAPLYSVLAKQGFGNEPKRLQTGDWEVVFTRQSDPGVASALPSTPPCRVAKTEPIENVDVDARGLEPPQPMIRILEALASLPAGAALRAHTERRPMHLYAQLEERGFAGETEEQPDGSHVTHIRRR